MSTPAWMTMPSVAYSDAKEDGVPPGTAKAES